MFQPLEPVLSFGALSTRCALSAASHINLVTRLQLFRSKIKIGIVAFEEAEA